MTSSEPAIFSLITREAATGVPWSSSPTMISVGSLPSRLPLLVIRIARPGDHLAEVAVHGGIVGQLGVKRRDENGSLAGHDWLAVALGQDFRARPEPPDAW